MRTICSKILNLPLLFILTGCVGEVGLTQQEAVDIAERELNFKSYTIKYAPITEVQRLCSVLYFNVAGCTTSQISLVSSHLTGCQRTEVDFHELMHQYQFIEQIATGRTVVSEPPAYEFAARMVQKYCYK